MTTGPSQRPLASPRGPTCSGGASGGEVGGPTRRSVASRPANGVDAAGTGAGAPYADGPCSADARGERPPRFSVVVPVYNEAANIAPLLRAFGTTLPSDCEILVCYDFEGDTTLPAIQAVPAEERPERLRLVRNSLGTGVRHAIEAGMKAACAPVVVVAMADLADDLARVEEMVTLAEGGADVVCGSRYMPGGSQHGGPLLKGLLSRSAGLTLHWFAGLPTRDPTNSFKAYRRGFLQRTPIVSAAGFSLGLELTVKAHFSGGCVREVPVSWRGRQAGQSRFPLLKWLPHYLRWYVWAFAQRLRGRPGPGRDGARTSPGRGPG